MGTQDSRRLHENTKRVQTEIYEEDGNMQVMMVVALNLLQEEGYRSE